jgi:hypothetical protein
MTESYPQTSDKYIIRFEEEGMRQRLKELAKASGRKTLNREINAVLLAHIANGGQMQAAPMTFSEADLDRLADKVALRLKTD